MTSPSPYLRLLPIAGALFAFPQAAQAQCSTWSNGFSPLGMDAEVRALTVFDDGSGARLFAGGAFTTAGGASAGGAATWNGSSWSALGAGLNGGAVHAFEAFDAGSGQALYAGGNFTQSGATPTAGLAVWNGSSWSALAGGGVAGGSATVHAIKSFDDGSGPALYVAGSFTSAGGVALTGLARWDGAGYTPVGDLGGGNAKGLAMEVFDDGTGAALYIGGNFTSVNGVEASNLARWDGSSWTDVERGVASTVGTSNVRAFAVFDDGAGPALFTAGNFDMAGGDQALNIARWDGAAWTTVAGGTSGTVEALQAWEDGSGQGAALYAAGLFQTAGGVAAEGIARMTGGSWSALEAGFGPLGPGERGYALAVFDDGAQLWPALFAGGEFTAAGGLAADNIGRWTNPCASEASAYCAAGVTASGCQATLSAVGNAARSLVSGFNVVASGVEGAKDGLFFFSTGGAQANPWGNGTSLQCVVPPVRRTGLLQGVGTSGTCDGTFQMDFNAWMAGNPGAAPLGGQTAYLQAWFRDPLNPSNQSTSLSDALLFAVSP